MKIDISVPKVKADRLTKRQVVLFTPEQNEWLLDFTKKRGLTVSTFIRSVMVQIKDDNG